MAAKKILYHKSGLIISELAQEFMNCEIGDRIESISTYQERYGVARGTVQNAINTLKKQNAIGIVSRGVLGSYITKLDFKVLSNFTPQTLIVGAMPLPYSKSYEGLATAIYQAFNKSNIDLSMSYIRGSKKRMEMLLRGNVNFILTSLATAKDFVKDNKDLVIVINFEKYSYLSEHVLVLRDTTKNWVEDGMSVVIDMDSNDQNKLSELLFSDFQVNTIHASSNQIRSLIYSGVADAGVWNKDEIIEKGGEGYHYVNLPTEYNTFDYNTAVILTKKNQIGLQKMLKQVIDIKEIKEIQESVKNNKIIPNY